ncbi:tRNA pseudouridine synthase-like 1 [Plectropomus leopardus]|uniref:tRNA pseudouridine synthase-like 1 n=1 Tax=Plectropomus leopardus TaxID=160734 RepID=UPI001C4AC209|nr:tRNA pseudouridine synthase-like 1 [Plectropomus leopardus]
MHNARYLIFFQYIGTKYGGAAKVPQNCEVKGIQNYLEDAIRNLMPVNPVHLSLSSRTDKGVHAFSNSAHFDLQRRNNRMPFPEDTIVEALNHYLKCERIRINRAIRVPDDFHARFRAQSRTYVYRIALGVPNRGLLPLTDCKLCWELHKTELDVAAMHEAATLLVGTQDFSTFRAVNSDISFRNPVKTLDMVTIQPGVSCAQAHFQREISFLELTFKSRSFLYQQVRRMTGALVAVGLGRLAVPQMKEILEARDTLAFPKNMTAPPCGLFLTRVDYDESDLQLSKQTTEDQITSSGNSED